MTTKTVRRGKPFAEPISLSEAKSHLRVLHNHEDAMIQRYIAVARKDAEEYCERIFASTPLACICDGFSGIALEPDTRSITSISYRDSDDAVQVVPDADYTFDVDRQLLEPVDSWPDGDRVTVEYIAGPDTTDSPPEEPDENVMGGMLEHLADLYNNREAQIVGTSIALNAAAKRLLDQARRNWGV